MWDKAVWIGVPNSELERCHILNGDLNNRFAYFRTTMDYNDGEKIIDISANSKYRLWINGKSVLTGPCKGDLYRHFYDTVDITPYLTKGKNIIAVQVLYCDVLSGDRFISESTPLYSVLGSSNGQRLAVEGCGITTGEAEWKVFLDGKQKLSTPDKEIKLGVFAGAFVEKADYNEIPHGWKNIDFDDNGWVIADKHLPIAFNGEEVWAGVRSRLKLIEREIPLLRTTTFKIEKFAGNKFFGNKDITVPRNQKAEYIFDATVHTNANMSFEFVSGKGATVDVTYAEKFSGSEQRDDINGIIEGITDKIVLSGAMSFEPFWYRTFRFIKLEIQSADEAVVMKMPTMEKIGYPLNVESKVSSSEKWVEKLWDISVRTLQNCMMDTYMDCPFYEQLQYLMDTRLQALFTFAATNDTRLAKKALEDFHSSRIPCGLLQGKFPSNITQVISTFSLYFVFMLRDYYEQTGDKEIVKKYAPQADEILNYYNNLISDGLVGNPGFWPFIDWVPEWQGSGTPEALKTGPSTIINLMYAYALECAAIFSEAVGRTGTANEYRERKNSICTMVKNKCWDDKRGMYREGPALNQYSQHAQAWAVLNDMNETDGAAIVERTLTQKDVIQCTFASSYELFRALEKTGLYGHTKKLIDRWIRLIDLGCTTCPETPVDSRSECHAWSALPMFELLRTVAGIRTTDAWQTVVVKPHMNYLPDIKGEAATPKGNIVFDYTKDRFTIILPEGLTGKFTFNNNVRKLSEGENIITI